MDEQAEERIHRELIALREDVERTLEEYMDSQIRDHIEECFISHQSGLHGAIINFESRHNYRFRLLMYAMAFLTLANIALAVVCVISG